MKNESEFQKWMRQFQEQPNETLVFCADDLFRQASGSVIRCTFWGVICGLLCITAVYLIIIATVGVAGGQSVSSVHEFVAALKSFRPSPVGWLFGAMVGGGWGFKLGEGRAVRLRAIALVALALARIEGKFSKPEESNKPPEHDSQSLGQRAI